jgi:type IV pilus assembly protein PilE
MDELFKTTRGFHLIEILMVLAIISIVTAFALPLYSQYMTGTRRLEAANTLSRLAVAMERFHIENNTYENATLAALSFPETIAKNNYHLAIQSASNNDYSLIAEPVGNQAEKDPRCAALILSANNKKTVTGPGSVAECW